MVDIFAKVTRARGVASLGRRGVPWMTVIVLAVVLACADGFWLVSLQGAIGAVGRTDHPFATWLRDSTAVLPVFVLAVLGALTLALHRFGPDDRRTRAVVATALLVVAAGTAVGMAAIVADSAYDYHVQSAQLHVTHALSSLHGQCDSGCLAQEERNTLTMEIRGVLLVSRWVLLTNLVLVAWMVAVMGGRIRLTAAGCHPRA